MVHTCINTYKYTNGTDCGDRLPNLPEFVSLVSSADSPIRKDSEISWRAIFLGADTANRRIESCSLSGAKQTTPADTRGI